MHLAARFLTNTDSESWHNAPCTSLAAGEAAGEGQREGSLFAARPDAAVGLWLGRHVDSVFCAVHAVARGAVPRHLAIHRDHMQQLRLRQDTIDMS